MELGGWIFLRLAGTGSAVDVSRLWTSPVQGRLHARCVQRQVLGIGQSRKLWRFRSCIADIVVDVPVCADRRLGLVQLEGSGVAGTPGVRLPGVLPRV